MEYSFLTPEQREFLKSKLMGNPIASEPLVTDAQPLGLNQSSIPNGLPLNNEQALESELANLDQQSATARQQQAIAGIGGGVDRIISGLTGIQPNSDYYARAGSMAAQGNPFQTAKTEAIKNYLRNKERNDILRGQVEDRAIQRDMANSMRDRSFELSKQRLESMNENRKFNQDYRKEQKLDKDVQSLSARLEKSGLSELDAVLNNLLPEIPESGDIPGAGLTAALPNFVLSDSGKRLRQGVTALQNVVLKARSGGAVTPQEADRLLSELGIGVTRSDEELRTGIKNTIATLQSKKANILAGFDEQAKQEFARRGGSVTPIGATQMVTIRNNETGETRQVTLEEAKKLGAQ